MQPAETSASPEQRLVGQVLAERYRVEKLLGSGGMGSVYLAEHVLMQKAVALKVLHPEMTALTEVVARFEREAVAAARIDHPNVAAATDFGRLDDGSFYLVLEYIAGKSLSEVIAEGPLELDRALVIGIQVGNALAAAHAAGIVHRDLKPDNVMLVRSPDGLEIVKVLDFGIAKVQGAGEKPEPDRALTRIGTVMGTAGYMAPEQALGQAVDARVDLYALGVVLYEMLSGRLPFTADEAAQILAKQLTEPLTPLAGSVPAELSALITRLLDNKVENRPQDVLEVVQTLMAVRDSAAASPGAATMLVGGEPPASIQAVTTDVRQASLAEPIAPISSPERRRSGLVAAALSVVVVLVAIGLWAARGSTAERDASSGIPSATGPEPADAPTATGARSAPKVEPAATSSSSEVTTTETKTRSSDGRTVTQTRATRQSTTTERRTTKQKRSTGPGGIYIPPPSEWFR